MKGKLFLTVVVCLFFVSAIQAQVFLKIDETQTKADFVDNRLQTALTIENSAQSFTAQAKLEILGADDSIIASSETRQTIKRGRQILQIPVEFSQKEDAENLLWKRLRYTISPENSTNSISDIVSLSEIMPEVFDLQISAPEKIFAGMKVRAHVLAVHPFTKKPVKNVEIAGKIELDLDNDDGEERPDEIEIKAKGVTNGDGFATLDFRIPVGAKIDDCCTYIKIGGAKNGITREAKEDLEVSEEAFVYLNTDKPIYQPAQKLFVRGLYLNALKRPLADKKLEFEITDEAGETIYEGTAKTSRFGVVNIEWQIPENFKLGTYKIEIDGDDDTIGATEFKVSRYDLPNFTVKTEIDKPFYLPEQTTAEITVNADYLFGKPVTKGKIKIVREKQRLWNYEKQEYEIDAGETAQGETDAKGKFIVRVDLSEAQKDLQNDEWKRFADVKFAAYFTDLSTNRTEQKRFDVRLSKEPIHVYFIRQAADANPRIPFKFYVSTFYADGTPARCQLKIEGNYPGASGGENKIAEAKTNSYGASTFEIRIPEKPFPDTKNQFDFRIFADDKKGGRGVYADNIYVDEEEKQIRVATDKTIYTPNESIEAKIFSTETEQIVFVEVLKNSSVVYSKRVKPDGDGRARVQIPFQPDFKGELTIAAYLPAERHHYNSVVHSKTIIFPAPENLNFNLKSLKTVYRPNEDAKISFSVRNGEGKPLETALGVVVLDKAIEERARTEQLPDNLGAIRKLLGTADVFGNLTRRDLDNLDLSKPINADLQLAAEFLLAGKTYEPNFFASDSYQEDFSRIYVDYFLKKLAPTENILKTHYEKTGEFPNDETSLRQILSASGVNFDELTDAWNSPFRAQFTTDRACTVLTLKTAAADKKFGTDDDFTAKEMRFEWFKTVQNKLDVILNNHLQANKTLPRTPDELKVVWKNSGFDFNALRDGWNRPFYLTSVKYNRDTRKILP
ncbi:MAG: MG2 domain-containing protein, partial [Acidobacteriota bacterium]|nr:MG2 domain-containing protein [Acidobacteriota bacterium]